jgi:hypothetical protein
VTASAFNFNFDIGLADDETPDPKPLTVFQLQRSASSLQSVLNAQAAAEATQQELLATGPLAEAAAADNKLLHNILSTYSTVQRLYHKAVLPFLMRHPQYIDSFAGENFTCHRPIIGSMKPGSCL